MATSPVDQERRIVPRWRDVNTTAAIGELDSVAAASQVANPSTEESFKEKVIRWESERATGTAAELVGAAVVFGRENDPAVLDAANFLATESAGAGRVLRFTAERLLGRPEPPSETAAAAEVRIRAIRSKLRLQPRDAVAWVELARQYSILGQARKSRDAMRRAVALVEGNRFVLRSAARLFTHLEDPEEAERVLRSREATRHDPWLLAAEIAVSSVAGNRSPYMKRARGVLADQNISPRHKTELAGALATVEFEGGNVTGAKKLFRQSLTEPNENSLAQADWASRRISSLDVRPDAFAVPRSFEARAWRFFQHREWAKGVMECFEWLNDEPFSARPSRIGSYFALVALRDFSRAEQLAREGLQSNPRDPGLLNNLAVALADQGRLDDAETAIDELKNTPLDGGDLIAVTATRGLLHFRRGRVSEGRKHYLDAISLAKRAGDDYMRLLANAHLVREELIARSIDSSAAESMLPDPKQLEQQFPDVAAFVSHLHQLLHLTRQAETLQRGSRHRE